LRETYHKLRVKTVSLFLPVIPIHIYKDELSRD
jgi:hypothetical protein